MTQKSSVDKLHSYIDSIKEQFQSSLPLIALVGTKYDEVLLQPTRQQVNDDDIEVLKEMSHASIHL